MTFDSAVALLLRARGPRDVFDSDDPAADYRRLAKVVHPDVAPTTTTIATAAFARLVELWEQLRRRNRVTTDRHTYTIGERLAAGDIADLIEVSYPDGFAVVKLARRPANNDLIRREAAALHRLERDGEARHRAYVPSLVDTFTQLDPASGTERAANVLVRLDGFVSLAVVARSYPYGVDPRDVAWMWRRLLVALGFAHRAGVIHGAVLPEHVLILPGAHGLVLIDWCYAVIEPGEAVPAMVGRYRDWYPPEVAARSAPGPATDIHLATRCMVWLMGQHAPAPLRRFARGCTQPALAARPQDAWKVLGELDDVLDALYGRRAFRPFTVPDAAR